MTRPNNLTKKPVIAGLAVDSQTVILQSRTLRTDVDQATLSKFGDDTWSLDPAIPHRHTAGQALHWSNYPRRLRLDTKLYVFALVNVVDEAPRLPNSRSAIPSIKTITKDLVYLRVFLRWLDERNIASISEVTGNDVSDYCHYVQADSGRSSAWKRTALLAVQRLHAYREHLPTRSRLPIFRPFGAFTAAQLAGDAGPSAINRTPRVDASVMQPMLSAALFTVTTIANDVKITTRRLLEIRQTANEIATEERRMTVHNQNRWGVSKRQLVGLIPAMRDKGLPLPAVLIDNQLVPDMVGLSKAGWLERDLLRRETIRHELEESGLELRKDWLVVKNFSCFEAKQWRRNQLDAGELVGVIRHVITACFLVIAYLSGIRTGEALNLRRNCISRDPKVGLIFMSGIQLKASPERYKRSPNTIPWVVTNEVADAVKVLESLVPGELLFPSGQFLSVEWYDTDAGRTRTPGSINTDLRDFIAWFNSDIAPSIAHPPIPADPDGPLTAPRLRRTLAWHIVHRPGGIIAGATQYGHVRTQIMQGYAGLADAGFTSELNFEQFLLRAEQLHENAERLEAGEQVSGPAAKEYRRRVADRPVFAGSTVPSKAQMDTLMRNPALTIHQGAMLTCVYRPESAKCQETGDETGPNWGQCKLTCSNVAYTDRDIQSVRTVSEEIDEQLGEPLLPAPIRHRLEQRCRYLQAIVTDHMEDDY